MVVLAKEKSGFFSKFFNSDRNKSDLEGRDSPIKNIEEQSVELNVVEKQDERNTVSSPDLRTDSIDEDRNSNQILESKSENVDEVAEVAEVAESIQANEADESGSFFQRLRQGISRSSSAISGGISGVFTKKKLNAEMLQDLEDILLQADLGTETALAITETLSQNRYDKEILDVEVKELLASQVETVLEPVAIPLEIDENLKPHVILMVGVNGTGKTTTIGKLASKLCAKNKSVILAAGDTFRAAAVDQLKIWGERTGAQVISGKHGADAAGLAFDAMKAAKEQNIDVLIIDTAGRLQNRVELMEELKKVIRVIKKYDESAPQSVLLTLDATTGQNALSQVEIFKKDANVTGLVITKLDGTARGGILVAISKKHGLPVHYIGIGERVCDLESFSARDFARAIAGLES